MQIDPKKILHRFDDMAAVIFYVDISEYTNTLPEDDSQNCLKESLLIFDEYKNSIYLKGIPFIIFFTNMDKFREKLKHTPLSVCFEEYQGKIYCVL